MGAVIEPAARSLQGGACGVPFVDVINTMLDASLPLTVGEYLEWGNPNEKAAFDYMRVVQPLRQPRAARLSGDARHDSLTTARSCTGSRPSMSPSCGPENGRQSAFAQVQHGRRPRRRFRPVRRLKETAFEYAWLMSQVGIRK